MDSKGLQQVQLLLLQRLKNSLPLILTDQDTFDALQSVQRLCQRLAVEGESNSCLIVGQQGVGKRALVECALANVKKEYPNVSLYEITLHASVHGDERSALRVMLMQLCQYLSVNQETISLLENLSFSDAMAQVLTLLTKRPNDTEQPCIPLVITIHGFDIYATVQRQSLLYTLLDTVQAARYPLLVMGTTTRMDCLSLLEKRVKSRFSHRTFYLYAPADFGSYCQAAKQLLLLNDTMPDQVKLSWNHKIEQLFQEASVQQCLRQLYDWTGTLGPWQRLCFEPIAALTEEQPFLTVSSICTAQRWQHPDGTIDTLKNLSLLELTLLIALYRLHQQGHPQVTFEWLYDHYRTLCLQAQWDCSTKAIAWTAMERLMQLSCVQYASATLLPKSYRPLRCLVPASCMMEGVQRREACPTLMKRWTLEA